MILLIGPIYISFNGISEENIPKNAKQFITHDEHKVQLSYHFHFVECPPILDATWELIFVRKDIRVFQQGSLEARQLLFGESNIPYAFYIERNEKEFDVYCPSTFKEGLQVDTLFFSCLSLERHLAHFNAYILHCSYLNYKGQAILFSGPSGIGKSTHSNLWCQHIPDTHVVNGDRCLIYFKDDNYYVTGWPVCGSSEICHIETLPIHAIVMMGQSPSNQIEHPRPIQLYKLLSSQITINWWNRLFVEQAFNWIQSFMGIVGVCKYACNMQPESTSVLYDYLKEKQWIN